MLRLRRVAALAAERTIKSAGLFFGFPWLPETFAFPSVLLDPQPTNQQAQNVNASLTSLFVAIVLASNDLCNRNVKLASAIRAAGNRRSR